ncbi:hypothetical protein FOT43_22310 [Serratia marcescens]|uniref:hypothetical protein n=1 Tax=Serratia marcescens TaxID=615 RepID=UPI00118004AA|nr:hypothetical protein [Serratia marcescens]TSB25825.1 hypothetical protein FOT43_22310 [Serratia marcescens]TXE44489.1 hypothetical protein FOT60_12365 [Serratia marcescens]
MTNYIKLLFSLILLMCGGHVFAGCTMQDNYMTIDYTPVSTSTGFRIEAATWTVDAKKVSNTGGNNQDDCGGRLGTPTVGTQIQTTHQDNSLKQSFKFVEGRYSTEEVGKQYFIWAKGNSGEQDCSSSTPAERCRLTFNFAFTGPLVLVVSNSQDVKTKYILNNFTIGQADPKGHNTSFYGAPTCTAYANSVLECLLNTQDPGNMSHTIKVKFNRLNQSDEQVTGIQSCNKKLNEDDLKDASNCIE